MASAATAEPADAETAVAEAVQQVKPAKRRRLMLIAAPLLLGVVGAGLWFTGLLHTGAGRADAKAEAGKPVLFAVPELVANLAAPPGVERYVKVDISLVAANAAAAAAARRDLPQLQNMFLTYLRDMHASELASSVGTWRLREALVSRAAIVLGPGRVTDVLFTKLLTQ